MNALQDRFPHLLIQRADRQLHQHLIVDNVWRMSRLNTADGHYRRFKWRDIARHDGLQRQRDVTGNQRGVNGMLRYRPVPAS